MTEGIDELPLVLRKEPFGGLLFIPNEAVHVELDHDGYLFVRDYLRGGRQVCSGEERELLARLQQELPGFEQRGLAVFEAAAIRRDYPFRVYASPTLADFQITERCTMGCPHCYASAGPQGREVPLGEVELVLRQLEASGITQIAIGGGEPLGHPQAIEILQLCHQHRLVPNLTTNGLHLGPDMLRALRRYCGAVALSLEGVGERFAQRRKVPFRFFEDCLAKLLEAGLNTVLQVTLSRENFGELSDIVQLCLSQPRLYGVIFLAYKQVGRGEGYHHVLADLDARRVHADLKAAFTALSAKMRVGYDCCLTPAIVGIEPDFDFREGDQLEGCSAMRSSIGVLANLDVTPCTFLPQVAVGNLRRQTLEAIWNGAAAERFRTDMARHMTTRPQCQGCSSKSVCLAGCPAFDLVGCLPAAEPR